MKSFKTYIKGEKIRENSPGRSQRNGWIYGAEYETGKDISEQMEEVLEVLTPKLAYSEKYCCEISCALFLNNREESVPWIHLDKRQIDFLKDVNAEFDLVIYYPPLY